MDCAGDPTFVHREAWGNNGGARQTTKPKVSVRKTKDSKPQDVKKSVGVVVVGETTSLTGQFVGETHRVLKCTQTHPPANQYLKEHNPLVGSKGSDRKWDQSRASGIVPCLTPSLTDSITTTQQ